MNVSGPFTRSSVGEGPFSLWTCNSCDQVYLATKQWASWGEWRCPTHRPTSGPCGGRLSEAADWEKAAIRLAGFAIALVAVLGGCGPRAWSPTDTAAQAAVTASLGVDYLQTRGALDSDPLAVEQSPVMGPRGDRVPPEVYFPACAVASAALAWSLPRPWRSVLQGAVLAVQADAIAGNLRAGYGVRW